MSYWKNFFQTLNHREKIIVNSLILVVIVSFFVTVIGLYFRFTKSIPVPGGSYSEGVIGQPMYVNPVLSAGNEADSDLCALIFSSLFKHDEEGKVVPDLAEGYEIDEKRLVYTVKIREGVKWHDGEPFTVDDVLFTYQIIQDPAYKSPLRQRWQGIAMEVKDDRTIQFTLPSPYVFFIENNLTSGILPRHVWETVAPGNFSLTEFNLRPIGTGSFQFSDFEKDSGGMVLSYDLIANEEYFGGRPYIDELTLEFYPDEETMIEAFNNKQIFGMGSVAPENLEKIKSKRSVDIHSLYLPRYFAVFFNQQKSKLMADRDIRKAISHATDRRMLIEEVLLDHGREIFSPILPDMFGYSDSEKVEKFEFDLEKAKETLRDAGWKEEGGELKKDGQTLEISLVTTDWPPLQKTAELLKSQWEKAGIKANIESLSISDIQQNYIRPREYEALLFGQSWAGMQADPFPLWHSSQTKDPGLNLALYSNKDADKEMEEIREETSPEEQMERYEKFQELLTDDIPALFVYSPNHIYATNKKIQGIGVQSAVAAQERFSDVTTWYVKTKRIRK